jgi:glycosyltransferase involved in cell wall biosynthesis
MKICFWGDIGKALKGNTSGGGELQVALIAKALAWGGHEVAIIDYDATEDFITEDGIKVFKINGWNNGIRVIRTFTHRLPRFYQSLKAQNADIYYGRIRDFRQIFVYMAARKVKGKFVLGLASNLDALNIIMRLRYHHFVNFSGLWGIINGILIEIVYPFLLRNADMVLVQHEGQRDILQKKHIKSTIFPNLFDLNRQPAVTPNPTEEFIYVGELNKRKGFNEFYEIIKKAPLHSFKVVGQPSGKTGFSIYEKLKSYKNVNLLGRLSHSDTKLQIANSKALISTSPMEGFPNVFIEAWACGIPVLSLYVDPGNTIEKENLGKVAHGNKDILLQELDKARNTDEFARRAKTYVENTHVLNINRIREIDALFTRIFNINRRELN